MPKKMKLNAVDACFERLSLRQPDPQTELDFTSPFTLLVAVVLSAQATDVGVNKATNGLFAVANTPAKMVAIGLETIRHHIRTIGLFNTKAKNVLALSKILVETYGGEVPKDRAALEALPGVGRKTANVVLNEAFGEPTIAVDTHILVMPGLHAANISFKLVHQLGNVSVVGPMMIGGEQAFQIVQMGASVSDIVQTAVLAAHDAIS